MTSIVASRGWRVGEARPMTPRLGWVGAAAGVMRRCGDPLCCVMMGGLPQPTWWLGMMWRVLWGPPGGTGGRVGWVANGWRCCFFPLDRKGEQFSYG